MNLSFKRQYGHAPFFVCPVHIFISNPLKKGNQPWNLALELGIRNPLAKGTKPRGRKLKADHSHQVVTAVQPTNEGLALYDKRPSCKRCRLEGSLYSMEEWISIVALVESPLIIGAPIDFAIRQEVPFALPNLQNH